jgi:hypothetical protein
LELNKCQFWQVRNAPDKDGFIFKSSDKDESFEERKRRFIDTVKLVTGSNERYFLEAWETSGQTKNWCRTWIVFNTSDPSGTVNNSIAGAPMVSGYSPDDVEKKIAEAVERYALKDKVTRLEAELKDIKEENDAITSEQDNIRNSVLKQIYPYVGTLLQSIIPNNPAVNVAGIEGAGQNLITPINTSTMPEKEITADDLADLLNRIQEIEPDYFSILSGALKFMENNPGVYKTMVRPKIFEYLNSINS